MKEELSSLDLNFLMEEIKVLINGRIDKIYQTDRNFTFSAFVPSKGKFLLKVLPNLVYLTNYKEDMPDSPPGFCAFLRKHIGSAYIRDVKQIGFERIIEVNLETKERKYIVIIELFGVGNLIVCDQDYKILSALESHKWRDRTIRGGVKYDSPPAQVNTKELSEKEFVEIVKSSKQDSIVKTLAIDFSLGGIYAEEVCLLSKIDKTKKELTLAESKEVSKQVKKLISKKLEPIVIDEKIFPFKLKSIDSKDSEEHESFSQAIDSVLSKKIISSQKKSSENVKNKKLAKIQAIIDQQEQTIKGLEQSEIENKKKGEFIYENYEQIKQILKEFNIARKKHSWEELKEILKTSKIIKKIKDKEGQLTIEI